MVFNIYGLYYFLYVLNKKLMVWWFSDRSVPLFIIPEYFRCFRYLFGFTLFIYWGNESAHESNLSSESNVIPSHQTRIFRFFIFVYLLKSSSKFYLCKKINLTCFKYLYWSLYNSLLLVNNRCLTPN